MRSQGGNSKRRWHNHNDILLPFRVKGLSSENGLQDLFVMRGEGVKQSVTRSSPIYKIMGDRLKAAGEKHGGFNSPMTTYSNPLFLSMIRNGFLDSKLEYGSI